MKLTVKKQVIKEVEVPFHKLSISETQKVLLDLFEDLCENDYEKYLKFLAATRELVNECCDGHDV